MLAVTPCSVWWITLKKKKKTCVTTIVLICVSVWRPNILYSFKKNVNSVLCWAFSDTGVQIHAHTLTHSRSIKCLLWFNNKWVNCQSENNNNKKESPFNLEIIMYFCRILLFISIAIAIQFLPFIQLERKIICCMHTIENDVKNSRKSQMRPMECVLNLNNSAALNCILIFLFSFLSMENFRCLKRVHCWRNMCVWLKICINCMQ